MNRYCWSILLLVVVLSNPLLSEAAEPRTELLWPQGAPGAEGNADGDKPTLTIYLPPADKATGSAVVICPGGGYNHLAMDHEGHQVAQWLNTLGVAGCIVKYRHNGTGYRHPAPLLDAQRAIRMVRHNASQWNIKSNKIGILGFSAGGHLASTAGTHFDPGNAEAEDPVDRVSCRPDFMILVYPVVSLGEPWTHRGSQQNLLGRNPAQELIKSLSNEKQVTAQTPPTFLVHTNEDRAVPAENSVQFYLALRKANVPAEMHIYENGPHGFGLGKQLGPASSWSIRCTDWLKGRALLTKP